MAGVHCGQYVQHFDAADLAEDDAVRAHPQRVADQVAGAHLAMPFGVGRAGFQAHHMRVTELQLGYVLDGHQTLITVDQLAQHVEHGGLARAGAAADQNVAAFADGLLEELENRLIDGLHGHQVGALEHVLAEFPDRQARAVQRNGRNDRVDPAAIGQACVNHR